MSKYFTIGEISKLFNISIKTLRYYDDIEILKPAYVNPENNYRYYSVEQFITIDLIKQFKVTGMSLENIKEIMSSKNSPESILESIRNHSNTIEKKIEELISIKKYLDKLEENISQNLEHGLNKVFIQHNKERRFKKYDVLSTNLEELDINLRDVILDIEKHNNEVHAQLGTTVSYESIVNENKVIYKNFKVFYDNKNEDYILPEGDYISIIFDDSCGNSIEYYKCLLEYIKENNIKVKGDFNEVWIMSKVDENLREKSLVKIEILKA